ncbi:MAG: type I-C CRISPR-associated protein Cas5c [Clostridia bacterium]|nr:type I-C CRISPR-associated protein Cas5c [Clostridia bacterium]MDD4686045.1 type I-C CRISPR-associated protein Cas5c [Clostridia bacterium]
MENTIEKKRNSVEFEVFGKYALFSDPVTRVGGEKFTYQVPTYQALKGMLESVYWKPTLVWIIDAVRVMKKIQTEGKGIRPINFGGIYPSKLTAGKQSPFNDLAYYTYLKDVSYQVLAHFEWNENRPDLLQDRNENKHFEMAKRMINKGGKRDVFLGTRECQAYVMPCKFGEGEGFYNDYGEINFGFMLHGINYPDETQSKDLSVRFWNCTMNNGIIKFVPPNDSSLKVKTVRENLNIKNFILGVNLKPIDEEFGGEK